MDENKDVRKGLKDGNESFKDPGRRGPVSPRLWTLHGCPDGAIVLICLSSEKNPQEARENLRQATQMANKIHNPNEKNEHMAMIGEAFIEARCYEEAQRTLGKCDRTKVTCNYNDL